MAADMSGTADIDTAEELGTQLVRLQRIRERKLAQMSVESGGVEGAAFVCLFRLLRDGPMRSSELATLVNSDPSTVSRQVAQLVEHGHVQRVRDEKDGRAYVLAVTETGRSVADRMHRKRTDSLGLVLADWTQEDRVALVDLLDRFLTDYERVRPDASSGRD
ncbi:MarR family transcriptional regulator [Rhodococcus sp. 15-649-1-2]|nr:MarR family transcriptional regulator [Rhodococcus sp. 15-649-1-2]